MILDRKTAEKIREDLCEKELTESACDGLCVSLASDRSLMPCDAAVRMKDGTLGLYVFDLSYAKSAVTGAVALLFELADGQVEINEGFELIRTVDKTVVDIDDVTDTQPRVLIAGSTEKDALSYKAGENIVFKLGIFSGTRRVRVPQIRYTVENSITGEKSIGTVDGSLGAFDVDAGAYDTAGVVTVSANLCDQSGEKIRLTTVRTISDGGVSHFRGSAVVEFEKILPYTKTPDDFDEFWMRAREALYATDLVVNSIVEKSSTKDGFKLFVVNVQCNAGGREGMATGYLTYPCDASCENKVGIMLRFEPYSAAGAPIVIYQDGMAVLSVSALGVDLERATDAAYLATVEDNRTAFFADPAKSALYFMILRDLQLSRFMMAEFGHSGRDWWNGKDFVTVGGSQGGFQAYAVAALDYNVTRSSPDIPWLSDVDSGNGNPAIKSAFWPAYSPSLRYMSGTSFAHLIKCEFIIDAGLGDSICPVRTVVAFYNALNCKKTIIFTQNYGHGEAIENVKYRRSDPEIPVERLNN